MEECKFSKTYFHHLTFYYEPNSFILPLSAIVDKHGIVICCGFWGFNWFWEKDNE